MKLPFIILLASATLALAQEAAVTPLGVSVSALQRDANGQVVNPLLPETGRPEPLMLVGAVLAPGTQVSFLIDLPENIIALASSAGTRTYGIELKSLSDSTGKDLLKLSEGGVAASPFWSGNRRVLVKTDNDRKYFVVALGLRAPRTGATSVKGELILDVSRGKLLTETKPFSDSGKILVGKNVLLGWGKGSPRPLPENSTFQPPRSTGPQLSTVFSEIAKNVVKIEILDSKDVVVHSIRPEPTTEHGVSFSDNGHGPFRIAVSYLDPNAVVEKMTIPFEVGLGVISE